MSIHLITGKKGEPHVTSQNQGIINSMLFGVGKYVFDFGSNFETYVYNNTVTIKDGQGLINGRHFEIEENTTESVVIENGEVGSSRYDLIVARYTKDNQGFEDVSLEVIKGESVRLPSVPTEPTFSDASILDGAILTEFPLYRVEVVGVSELTVTPKFDPKNVDLTASLEDIAELSDEVQDLIDSQVVDKDYVPSLFNVTGEPPSSPQSSAFGNNEPKYGDICISHNNNQNFKMYVLNEIGYNPSQLPVYYGWKRIVMAEEIASKIDRIDAPKIYYGTTEPTNLVADYPNLMLGDLYFQYALGSGTRDGFGEIQKIWMAGISSQNEDMAVWREITTSLSAKWSDYYTKTQTDNLLTTKLNRDDGIKLFYGTTDPSQNLLDGSKSGDIYIRLNGGNDRDMSQVVGMWIVSVYPSSGTYYWQKIPLGEFYTKTETYNKTETDTLLNAKQGTLTAGNNITIDANNVISATGGGNLPSSTVSDSGKFLRVNSQGNAEWQTVPKAENNSF